MTKTIDKVAKQFTDELFAHDDLTDIDTQTEKNDAYVLCMAFGNHLMEQPLADRLTAEERKKIKALHDRRWQTADLYLEATCINAQESSAIDFCKGYAQALRDIFGKAMFAEEGGRNE